MKVTRVDVRLVRNTGKSRLRGYFTADFDNVFRVNSGRIIETPDKTFLAMPSKENFRMCKDCGAKISYKAQYCSACGKEQLVNLAAVTYKDVCHALDKTFATEFESAVLAEYNKAKVIASNDNGSNS